MTLPKCFLSFAMKCVRQLLARCPQTRMFLPTSAGLTNKDVHLWLTVTYVDTQWLAGPEE